MTWQIALTPTAKRMLEAITDRRVRRTVRACIDGPAHDPDQQGMPLLADLAGYRSLRAVGQRYRIIYRIDRGQIVVVVVAVGLLRAGDRRGIYALARKLLRLRLLEPPPASIEGDEP
jgi:mRNA interferase RelE/StbE